MAILGGCVRPGIWFPEEAVVGRTNIATVLGLSATGAHTLVVDSTDGLEFEEVWGSMDNKVALEQV